MIWIRADANQNIGTGHVMRCIAIAAALRRCGRRVCFLVADEAPVELLARNNCDYRVLHTAYDRLEEELLVLCELLEREKPQLLLVDSYYVTPKYLEALRALVRLAYMDDKNMFPYPVDILINYNIYGKQLPYRKQACRAGIKYLLGPSYAPLREEFCNSEYWVRKRMEHVMITTGGSDKYNLAGQILQQVLADEYLCDFQYHVICGAFYEHLEELKEWEKKYSNVFIHQNVRNMSEWMQLCDAAITAGGSTMYELSAIGVPIICFSFVDNQEQIVKTFVEKKLALCGANYLLEKEKLLAETAEALRRLADSRRLRTSYSEKTRKLVDGQGADRIAYALCEDIRKHKGRQQGRGAFLTGMALLCLAMVYVLTFPGEKNIADREAYQLVVFGDSLLGNIEQEKDTIPELLGQQLGKTVYNATLGGTSMSYSAARERMGYTKNGLTMASLAKSVVTGDFGVQQTIRTRENATEYFAEIIDGMEHIDFEQVEILLLEFGMNDYHMGAPIYAAQGAEEYSFIGALKRTVTDIREAYPNIRIVLLTPTYSWYLSKQLTCEEYDLGGGYLEDYVEAEITAAKELGVELIDLYHDVYPHTKWEDWSLYTRDGVHPNEAGNRLLLEKIAAAL